MKRLVVVLLIATAILSGCAPTAAKPMDGFLGWTDGYIAAARDSTYDVVWTYFYSNNSHFLPRDVVAISFADMTEATVESFEIAEMKTVEEYEQYTLNLKIKFNEKGLWTAKALQMNLSTGEVLLMPFGDMIFDVDELDEQHEPIEEAPFYNLTPGTSLSDFYMYSIDVPEKYELLKMHYGAAEPENMSYTFSKSGKLPIEYDAPVVIIRPKFEIIFEGENRVVYGSGSYCGALNVSPEELAQSMERNKVSYIKGD